MNTEYKWPEAKFLLHCRTRVWPSDTFVDFENRLNTAVKKLRQAPGDQSDTPRYVETLPRRGIGSLGDWRMKRSKIQSPVPSK